MLKTPIFYTVKREIEERGGDAVFMECDRAGWDKGLELVKPPYGGPNILANNANTTCYKKPTIQFTVEDLGMIVLLNCKAILLSVIEITPYFARALVNLV